MEGRRGEEKRDHGSDVEDRVGTDKENVAKVKAASKRNTIGA